MQCAGNMEVQRINTKQIITRGVGLSHVVVHEVYKTAKAQQTNNNIGSRH